MVLGMAEGWFTGKQFASYLPATGPATTVQFALARHIINGLDRVTKVAGYTVSFQAALVAGGWVRFSQAKAGPRRGYCSLRYALRR